MAIYYIFTKDGDVFELDATTDMINTTSVDITQHKIEDGSTVSDHAIVTPERLSFSGVITDIKLFSTERTKTTDQFITGLKALAQRMETFTAVWREDTGKTDGSASIYRLPNCLFRTLSISQDQEMGYSFGKHAYRVSMDIEQIRVAKRANITVDRAFAIQKKAPDVDDPTTDLDTSAGGSPTELEGPESEKIWTKLNRPVWTWWDMNVITFGE